MEKQSDQAQMLMNRLQEREREQFQVLSICNLLSSIINRKDFELLVQNSLKDFFGFEDFILAITDENENEYQIFSQHLKQKLGSKNFSVNDGFFDTCMESAEAVIFDLKNVSEKNFPEYISKNYKSGFKNAIGICLPYSKGNRNVVFLFYKNPTQFTRETNRILKGIGMQLSITVKNILTAETYKGKIIENKIATIISEELQSEQINSDGGFHGIIGESKAMQNVFDAISNVASSTSSVLIFGETGTGKELVARAIHELSDVSSQKMVKVNCASIPVNLIESELFGHEKGAFTGATEMRIGKFEQAENSTLFLDEIGELPLELQGKLLRVLQEKEIERIGGKTTVKVNARVIAATNRNLETEVATGNFRSDLYYRLNVFPIQLPALRERKGDITLLANYFLVKHSSKIGKKITGFSKKILNAMNANPWLGNVRELENMVERSILFEKGEVIKEMKLPEIFVSEKVASENEFHVKTLQEIEKEHILKVVKKCNGRIFGPQGAAILLDLPGTTLVSKMQKLGIKKEHFVSEEK